jgi:hypothetical protein
LHAPLRVTRSTHGPVNRYPHRTRLKFCLGTGSPTVVFDSRLGDWAPVWMIVQPEVAKWTRACSYDRAGAGFGDPGWSGPHFDQTIAA